MYRSRMDHLKTDNKTHLAAWEINKFNLNLFEYPIYRTFIRTLIVYIWIKISSPKSPTTVLMANVLCVLDSFSWLNSSWKQTQTFEPYFIQKNSDVCTLEKQTDLAYRLW